MPSQRRLNLHYIALQCAFWGMYAAACAYQTALLLDRGFPNTQVGILVALRCVAGALAQPVIGGWADKHPNVPLKWIVCLSLLVSFTAGLAFLTPMPFAPTCVIFLVLGGLELSAYPLLDAMGVQFIRAGANLSYSLGRGVGSVSYAVLCALLGLQVGAFGVESTLITHLVLMVVLLLTTATFPKFDPKWQKEGEQGKKPQSALRLLRTNPRFTLMLLGILLGITAVLPMSNFLVNVVRARGGEDTQLGVALFIMASFELPAAFLFNKLYAKKSAAFALVFSMVFMTGKALALLMTRSVLAVWLVQPIQMLGYGVFIPASVYYVSDSLPGPDQVKGQTLMMVASNGLGGMLGSLIAGSALNYGVDVMLWCLVALGAASAVVTAIAAYAKFPKSPRCDD